ncbi:hypothetical protein GCM10027423_17270 [Spirosoma arcticum]
MRKTIKLNQYFHRNEVNLVVQNASSHESKSIDYPAQHIERVAESMRTTENGTDPNGLRSANNISGSTYRL